MSQQSPKTRHQEHTVTVPEDKQEYTRRKHKRHQENEPKDNQEYTVTEPKQRRQGRKERVTKKFAIEMKQPSGPWILT